MQRRKREPKSGLPPFRTIFDYSQPVSPIQSIKKIIGRTVITILSLLILYVVYQAVRPLWQTSAVTEASDGPSPAVPPSREEISSVSKDTDRSESLTPDPILQVEVLNGCGATGVGSRFTNFLRSHGYDVVKTDNADSWNYPNTLVIDRKGDSQLALELAEVVGTQKVIQQIETTRQLHFSVIIGKDFKKMKAYNP